MKCDWRLDKEVLDACMEFEYVGITADYCRGWQIDAQDRCAMDCLDCSTMAGAIATQCRFALLDLNVENANVPRIEEHCLDMAADFEDYRCPNLLEPGGQEYWNSTHDTYECTLPEGEQCMAECGNYQNCWCQSFRLNPHNPPDLCEGYVLHEGIDRYNTSQNYSCANMPQHCRSDIDSFCGTYRWCPSDMCLIKDVDCMAEIPDQCQEFDLCEPRFGLCYFKDKPLGTPCDDDVFWTLNDTCQHGFCIGFADYCVKYNVTCTPSDSCTFGGTCHPHNGRCTFEQLNDTEPCDDHRPWTVEDRCQSGLCVGRAVDLCVENGIQCTVPNSCYQPGTCNPFTGVCSDPDVLRDVECDDGNPLTLNDTCIDGVCISGRMEDSIPTTFLTLGKGACGDRDRRRMASYSGDVHNELECEAFCMEDLQCAGYAYNYPLCTIYGTLREQPPVSDRQWAFLAGTDPPAVIIEDAWLVTDGQRESYCRRRGYESDTLEADAQPENNPSVEDFFSVDKIALFAAILLFITSWCTVCVACKRCLFQKVEEDPVARDWVKQTTGKDFEFWSTRGSEDDDEFDWDESDDDDQSDGPPTQSLRDLGNASDAADLKPPSTNAVRQLPDMVPDDPKGDELAMPDARLAR